MLAVVTSVWLLRKLLTTCLNDGTWRQTARLEAHQDSVRAAEAEDVCFAHSAGFETSLVWSFQGCVFNEVPGPLIEEVKLVI